MFDMSWSEMLLIAVVALIVIGPKDLPKVLRTLAFYARKARGLAREFQSGIEEMAREAELDEVKRAIDDTTSIDLAHELEHSIDPTGSTASLFELESPTTSTPATEATPAPQAAPAEAAGTGAGHLVSGEFHPPAPGEPAPVAHADVPTTGEPARVLEPAAAGPVPALATAAPVSQAAPAASHLAVIDEQADEAVAVQHASAKS